MKDSISRMQRRGMRKLSLLRFGEPAPDQPTRKKTMMHSLKKLFVTFLMTAFTFVGFVQTTQAAMIGTDQIQAANAAQQNRDRIAAAMNRPDVMSQLEKLGVNKADAQLRVAALTDAEAATVASKIDSLPAGGDSVVGVLLFIFVLLLITDLLGLTKIFPFTRSMR